MCDIRVRYLPLLFLLLAPLALGQGLPNGSMAGRVTALHDGQPLPGVSVTVTSPNLQGIRTAATNVNGDYYFANLPPGQYTVRFELDGLEPYEEAPFHLGASQNVTVNARLRLKRVAADLLVTARSEQVSTGAADAATYTGDTMSKLPTARTLLSAAYLAPGVNQNGPNGAITISGASSFENVIMVNGANVQDNIRETPNNLFIEDAIQETTTTSSGVSAEFGRFTGGVVNTITKSGGNNFSGSFRATLNNDTWRELTPYPADAYSHAGTLPTYEATLGGPFWKDHVWFFGAYRHAATSFTGTTAPPTLISFDRGSKETRWEGKLTLTPRQNQTVTGSYLTISNTQTGYYYTPVPIFDLASVYDRQLPNNFWIANYSGVLSESLFLEGQYSQKHFTFVNSGGTDTSLIGGTVLTSFSPFGFYHSPVFCAVCPNAAEKRDNWEGFGKFNWFASPKILGTHNMVLGFDIFNGSRTSNNWQSGSSYFIGGNSVIFQNGNLYPVIGVGSYLNFNPILQVAQPSSVKTISAFFNDAWKLNEHFSFNLGVRYDKNDAKDSLGVTTSNDSKWSPRLAIIWDPTGKGTFRVNASYAIYVAAPAETIVGAGSTAGEAVALYYYYEGPPINTNGPPYMTQNQAIQAVFDWFGITGPNRFPKPSFETFWVYFPSVIQKIVSTGLVSPNTQEWTVGVGGSVGARFTYRVEGVYRNYTDFYALYTNTSTGAVTDTAYTGNTYDLGYVGNGGDPMSRKYFGLHTNLQWRPFNSLNIGASWTWSHTYGNTLTETTGSGPVTVNLFQYPEYHDNAWYAPVGNLPQDQRHRARIFGTWDIPFPKFLGHLGLGFLWRLDTGLGYGALGSVATRNYVTNPGYVTPPSSVSYWYTSRDAFRTATANALDLSLNYGINIGPVEIFIQPQVINVWNDEAIVFNTPNLLGQTADTAVNVGTASYARFNPFTTVPVLGPAGTGANWKTSSTFGQALSATAYETPLTFRISMGIRF